MDGPPFVRVVERTLLSVANDSLCTFSSRYCSSTVLVGSFSILEARQEYKNP